MSESDIIFTFVETQLVGAALIFVLLVALGICDWAKNSAGLNDLISRIRRFAWPPRERKAGSSVALRLRVVRNDPLRGDRARV
jgi:hypothetical protein